ncbi:MAG TPA: DUF4105 domain-containing protein [Candidatus Methylacidiphilales bacterium]|nr:DUF4105 domain-containing protein [Candidatus Methylacidiphilales bacterium]
MKQFLRWIFILISALAGLLATGWAAGALYFDLPAPAPVRMAAAILWAVTVPSVLIYNRFQWRVLTAVALVFLLVLGWWLTLQPRLDRDWKPGLAVLPYAVWQNDDTVVVHNIRNFEYRTETDFTPRYETRTYQLSQLRGIDAFQTYWGSPAMAHPIMSFDFGPQGRLAFSIEARYEKGETYSPIGGIYRKYEIIALAADERDVVRLRTNIRSGEDAYLYRLNVVPETARMRFREYISTINELKDHPRWYNAITHNCTTTVRNQLDADARPPWDWRIVVTGYADEMLYESGSLDQSVPFAELKKRAHINARAIAAGNAPDFSEQIRTHLTPRPESSQK